MAHAPANGILEEDDGVASEQGDTISYTASLVRQGRYGLL